MVEELSRKTKSVIAVSGILDIVTDGQQTIVIRNGCSTMARLRDRDACLQPLSVHFAAHFK